MSLAAGIVPRVEGHHDSGPAAREAACAQGAYAGHGQARPQQRTLHDLDEAGRGRASLRYMQSFSYQLALALRTEFDLWPCGQNLSSHQLSIQNVREFSLSSTSHTSRAGTVFISMMKAAQK